MECPWCYEEIKPRFGHCPVCRREIYIPAGEEEEDAPGTVRTEEEPEGGGAVRGGMEEQEPEVWADPLLLAGPIDPFMRRGQPAGEPDELEAEIETAFEQDPELIFQERFKCAKCGGTVCKLKEVSLTGTGLSKVFDIQHMHYWFVSCVRCGYVEIYDPDVLRGHSSGRLGTVLDLLFGG